MLYLVILITNIKKLHLQKLFLCPILECSLQHYFRLLNHIFKSINIINFNYIFLLRKSAILSKGITSRLSYKSVCTAPEMSISSLLSPFSILYVSLLK